MTIVIIAWRDAAPEMLPVSRNGTLATFPSIEAARRAAGPLGVGVAVEWERVKELCERHKLKIPVLAENQRNAGSGCVRTASAS